MADPNIFTTSPGFDYGASNAPDSTPAGDFAREVLRTGEAAQDVRPGTKWETLMARFRSASLDYPTGLPGFGESGRIPRLLSEQWLGETFDKQGRKKMSAEEANQKFPGMPLPFTEDVHPEIAEIRYNTEIRRRYLQEYADRGPTSGGYEAVAGAVVGGGTGAALGAPGGIFGAAIGGILGGGIGAMSGPVGAGMALDPLNLALGVAVGQVTRYMGVAPTARNTFVENLAVNTAVEVPTFVQGKREGQEEYDWNLVNNTIGSALLGTAIHVGLKKGIDALASGRMTRSELRNAVGKGIAETESGKRISDPIPPRNVRRFFTEQREYQWQQRAPHENTFWAATDPDTGQPVFFDSLGRGVYGSDNPEVANSHAARPGEQGRGKVTEFTVDPNAKIFDLDAEIPEGGFAKLVGALESALGVKFDSNRLGDRLAAFKTNTVKALIDSVSDRAGDSPVLWERMGKFLQSQGYDGMAYVKRNGEDVSSDNRIMIFDPEGRPQLEGQTHLEGPGPFKQIESKDADPSSVPPPDETWKEKLQDPANSTHAHQDIDQELPGLKTAKVETPDELDPFIREQEANAKAQLAELEKQDPSLLKDKDYAALKELATEHREELTIAKLMENCMRNGGGDVVSE